MVEMLAFLKVPLILFMAVVAPLWIIQHYRHKSKAAARADAVTGSDLARMAETARRLEDRITVLEQILDREAPGWRTR
ncbi:envelope stress response membrane protein PspB [Novispirillum itersonii]|uniref:envelope stress response membrane protein PspB n=1 Tax=Novispirillum itersonii TaxID=189 RepID=UPI000363BB42|nr:envelope stress response membrane protein PspB [Novispirillum itersonii]